MLFFDSINCNLIQVSIKQQLFLLEGLATTCRTNFVLGEVKLNASRVFGDANPESDNFASKPIQSSKNKTIFWCDSSCPKS